ncbi:MAG: CBS domain-containing protein [Spirochaetaceae bacterium]|nr:CBS domain-containing protein [Spirochaetaceae bacterium]
MTVNSVMTRNPFTLMEDNTVTDAQSLMDREKIHRLPVINEQKKLVGIVSKADLLEAAPSSATTLTVYEMNNLLAKLTINNVMSRDVLTVTPETLVEDAARLLVDKSIGGLPVMEGETLVGIVTETDLFRLLIDLFGTRRKGVRATLRVPERAGEVADMTKLITDAGGNIISIGTFPGNDITNAVLILKVEQMSKDKLLKLLEPLVIEVMDVREV